MSQDGVAKDEFPAGTSISLDGMLKYRECVISSPKNSGDEIVPLLSVGKGDDKWHQLPEPVRKNTFQGMSNEDSPADTQDQDQDQDKNKGKGQKGGKGKGAPEGKGQKGGKGKGAPEG